MNGNGIGDYGVIGDLHTVALVGKDGSIDWCCLPRFDSPSVFGALLDRRGGYFQIAPCDDGKRQQLYLPETNVLLTRFLHRTGVGEVTDFMPIESDERGKHPARQQIVRLVSVVRGQIRFRLHCSPAFNYGRDQHRVVVRSTGAMFQSDAMTLTLRSPIPLTVTDGAVTAEFVVAAGETVAFYLEASEEAALLDMTADLPSGEALMQDTLRF